MTEQNDEEPTTIDESAKSENREDPHLRMAGGWLIPGGESYDFLPPITVRRGGISFTGGPDFKPMSKTQLQRRVDELLLELGRERQRNHKLRRKIRRLLKLLGRLA